MVGRTAPVARGSHPRRRRSLGSAPTHGGLSTSHGVGGPSCVARERAWCDATHARRHVPCRNAAAFVADTPAHVALSADPSHPPSPHANVPRRSGHRVDRVGGAPEPEPILRRRAPDRPRWHTDGTAARRRWAGHACGATLARGSPTGTGAGPDRRTQARRGSTRRRVTRRSAHDALDARRRMARVPGGHGAAPARADPHALGIVHGPGAGAALPRGGARAAGTDGDPARRRRHVARHVARRMHAALVRT
jgi:hypothetical protein